MKRRERRTAGKVRRGKPARAKAPVRAGRGGARATPRSGRERREYLFAVQEKQGTVLLTGPRGVPVLPRFWAGVELAQGDVMTTCQAGLSAGPGAWVSQVANGRITIGIALRRCADPSGVLVQVSVFNRGPEPLSIRQIRVAHTVTGADASPWGPASDWSLLRMGFAPGAEHREDADPRASSRIAFADERVVARSWDAAALRFGGGPGGLVAGFVTGTSQPSWIDVRRDRHTIELAAVCETEGTFLPAGRRLVSETLYLGLHADVRDGLAGYASLCGRRARVKPREVADGWCTGSVAGAGEEEVLARVRAMSARRQELPMAVFRIDEGWERSCGDWTETNDRFPGGLAALATAIAEAGFVPGLALSPFAAGPDSAVFRRHPDWMVKDAAGAPLGWETGGDGHAGTLYGLDGSHPEVQDHLRELFRALRRLGFGHFMLDRLYLGCLRGARAEPVTRARAYRLGLEAIREGAGGAYLLGGMGPFLPSAGVVDGMRTRDDAAPGGPAALAESHRRWWAHRALWNNDAGPLPAASGGGEAEAALTAAGMSGGAIFSAESAETVTPGRAALIREAAGRRRERPAVPVDVLDRDVPRVLSLPLGRGRYSVAVFNEDDLPRVVTLDLAWFGCARARIYAQVDGSRRPLGVARRRCLTPPIPPHGVRVLLIEEA